MAKRTKQEAAMRAAYLRGRMDGVEWAFAAVKAGGGVAVRLAAETLRLGPEYERALNELPTNTLRALGSDGARAQQDAEAWNPNDR